MVSDTYMPPERCMCSCMCFLDGPFFPPHCLQVAGKDFGDFMVMRGDGQPSYQLSCVVDDAAMGITEVVRGEDLLTSTCRQILLYRALGLQEPRYILWGLG